MPSARPILMSAPMVRALLAGTKTQTRRIVKPQPKRWSPEYERQWFANAIPPGGDFDEWSWWEGPPHGQSMYHHDHCPYGKPGDLLWVRETWVASGTGVWTINDARTRIAVDQRILYRADRSDNAGPWWSSIHMPREFSRLTLEITEVRVQRLQDISEGDSKAEGAARLVMDDEHKFFLDEEKGTHRTGYAGLWNHINGDKDGADWDSNPWVWALTFKVHNINVDALLQQMVTA